MSQPTKTPRPSLDHDLFVVRPSELIEARGLVVADTVATSYVRLGLALADRPARLAAFMQMGTHYLAAAEVRALMALNQAAREHREVLAAAQSGRRLRVVGSGR